MKTMFLATSMALVGWVANGSAAAAEPSLDDAPQLVSCVTLGKPEFQLQLRPHAGEGEPNVTVTSQGEAPLAAHVLLNSADDIYGRGTWWSLKPSSNMFLVVLVPSALLGGDTTGTFNIGRQVQKLSCTVQY